MRWCMHAQVHQEVYTLSDEDAEMDSIRNVIWSSSKFWTETFCEMTWIFEMILNSDRQ